MHRVNVTTGARLHFGLLSADPTAVRQYGGIGLMIDQPGFRVTVGRIQGKSEQHVINAPAPIASRVRLFLDEWNRTSDVALPPLPALAIDVSDHMPSHGGMGSGTQLALALGRGLSELLSEKVSTEQLAVRLGRGNRSAIGIHGFQHGGFIVDAGKAAGDQVGQLAVRYDWPDDWPIILITLDQSAGLSGEAEVAAFRQLPPMDHSLIAELSGIIENRLMPAISMQQQGDFRRSLDQYGDLVGDYFGPAQGGRYADHRMRTLVAELRRQNVTGIAQSSWGPTVCVVCTDKNHADQLVDSIRATNFAGDARIVSGLNRGATVSQSDSAVVHTGL